MAEPYNHRAVEQKWRRKWEENPINVNDGKKPKYYCLDMFPYPSGSGLHVGHWRGYVISDVWSRYKMLQGYYLIHPMGWDAFGLPAENYAIKMGTHPKITTASNIKNIKRQINEIAAIYDWDMEVKQIQPYCNCGGNLQQSGRQGQTAYPLSAGSRKRPGTAFSYSFRTASRD